MKSKTKTISENRKSAKAAIPKKSLLSLKDKTKKNGSSDFVVHKSDYFLFMNE
jgi:hypothetical protein